MRKNDSSVLWAVALFGNAIATAKIAVATDVHTQRLGAFIFVSSRPAGD
jgi:hypothetical protein